MSGFDATAPGVPAMEWFAKAETNLTSARLLLAANGPAETMGFLAQQAAEKYLKGYLVWQGVPFRKIHDLLELLNACRTIDPAFTMLQAECAALNPLSVRVRYPGFSWEFTIEDAEDALTRAERIRALVRQRLGLVQ